MSKKLFFTILTILTLAFSFTYVFAADGLQGAANTVRNVVGGAENTIENAAKGVSNTSKNATGAVENGGKNVTGTVENTGKNTAGKTENVMTTGTKNNDTAYSATRTSTGTPKFMGMTSTAWTWLILGIAAIVIIGLVWYYSMQLTGNNYDNGDNE